MKKVETADAEVNKTCIPTWKVIQQETLTQSKVKRLWYLQGKKKKNHVMFLLKEGNTLWLGPFSINGPMLRLPSYAKKMPVTKRCC
jgi:hypothetical protein